MAEKIYQEPSFDYILIKVKKGTIEEKGFYEAVRKAWKMDLGKAKQIHYVFGVVDQVVREVYKVDNWYSSQEEGRIEFNGKKDEELTKKYEGYTIPECYRKKGMASPALYSNSFREKNGVSVEEIAEEVKPVSSVSKEKKEEEKPVSSVSKEKKEEVKPISSVSKEKKETAKFVFSVSQDKKVVFAKGNLQYQASTKKWRFAEKPWDYVGDDNKNISDSYSGWIDLFGWGTGNNPTNISEQSSDYLFFFDWGNFCGLPTPKGTAEEWRTLTKDEWDYVMFKRTTPSGVRFAKAKVNNINGVIVVPDIVPDMWRPAITSLKNQNDPKADFTNNVISVTTWTSVLEPAGCVFLPAAGSRQGSDVYYVGSDVYCWSSTPDGSGSAYNLRLVSTNFYVRSYDYRYYGFSVRLVADIQK